MKLKRVLSIFLVLTLWLALTGCNAQVDVTNSDSTTTSTTTTTTTTAGTVTTTTATTGIGDITIGSVDVTGTIVTPSYIPTTESTATVTTTTTTVTTTTTTKATTTATTVSAADKQLVDRAMKLATGETIESATLTGVVTDIREAYNEGYGNATFDLQVLGTEGAKTIYCYRVKPADSAAANVEVGDVLSLTGTIQNYKGTIEFYPAEYTHLSDGGTVTTATPTTRPTGDGATIDEDGIYESKDDVALYLHTYGKLPKNFVTKSEYNSLGKPANKCCGGDRFYNKEGLLPNKAGRLYYECDIDTYGITSRGAKRIVYSNDGLIYYTGDHYGSFTLLYGTP